MIHMLHMLPICKWIKWAGDLSVYFFPRHLPIERIDEEANFAASSNINETRFHKAGGDRTQKKNTWDEIDSCLAVITHTWRN